MKASKTALFRAAKTWDVESLVALLSLAPHLIDATDPRGRKALHIACTVKPGTPGTKEPNGIRTVTALLRHGAGLNDHVGLEEGTFKATPIWWAVAHGDNLPLVKLLLKRGARADNCLFAVVWNDNTAILREILKTRPPLNEFGEREPAVISAIRWRKLKTLGMLLDAGADLSFRDAKGRDALAFARHKKLPPSVLARLEALQSAK
jgi:hypothetical protein